MPVYFYIPDQMEAWGQINKTLLDRRSGWARGTAEELWQRGKLGIHEVASELGPFGYLVLTTVAIGNKAILQVLWCEIRPCRALRQAPEWLSDAAGYLREVAQQYSCEEVRICVATDHPSTRWQTRLQKVGFAPVMTELSMKVAA